MLQAWDVKRKRLVNVLRMSETGAIISYSPADQPGLIILPLIENGRNAEPYEILQDIQLSMEF